MDKPTEVEFAWLLFTGISVMLLLAVAIVVFIVVYQKKAHAMQVNLQQQELEHQQAMLGLVVASQETERERIAQDLHDEIGGALAAAQLIINQLRSNAASPQAQEMAQQASQIVGETVQNMRHIVRDISPAMLVRFGFRRAVTMLATRLETTGMLVHLQVDASVETWEVSAQLALYRIVQEFFANTLKHAQAHHLTLDITTVAGVLKLRMSDDGRGFALQPEGQGKSTGMGLAGIRARARVLNADLNLTSAPGQGTQAVLIMVTAADAVPVGALG